MSTLFQYLKNFFMRSGAFTCLVVCCVYKEIKKHPRENLIIVLTIVSIWIAASSWGDDKQYRQQETILDATPFFKYRFSEENKGFIVEGSEDVSIHSVRWFSPDSEKSFNSFVKHSNLLTLDDIFSQILLVLMQRKIFIPSLGLDENTPGYIRCNILAVFDDYMSEKDSGFPLGVLIEYTKKGRERSYYMDITLLKGFVSDVPQIQIIKNNAAEGDLKVYMEKGAERLKGILPIYPWAENETYEKDNRCTRLTSSWNIHYFREEDRQEAEQTLRRALEGE